jgi:hypothetical protein
MNSRAGSPAVPSAVPGKTERRPREQGLEELRLALLRLQRRNAKISITAVAVEAGYKSGAVVHNVYPAFRDELLALTGKAIRAQRDKKHADLVAEREASRKLREENAALRADLARIASINEALKAQLGLMSVALDPKIVPFCRG